MDNLFEIRKLKCSYDKPFVPGRSKIVLNINKLDLPRGKKVFIVGESGIGKSTVLEVLGMMNNTLVKESGSKFVFCGNDKKEVDLLKLWDMGDKALSRFRLDNFNFIFQSTNLMRNFTAFENIAFTRMLQGYSMEESFQKTEEILHELGLPHIQRTRMAQELSGGQQQRLAFARAILPDFSVLFGDEPTGNLDADNAERAMRLLSTKLNSMPGSSAIIVSHDMKLSVSFADIIVKIRKEWKDAEGEHDDASSFGVIDDTCVYYPDESRTKWSNGNNEMSSSDFEKYLKKNT